MNWYEMSRTMGRRAMGLLSFLAAVAGTLLLSVPGFAEEATKFPLKGNFNKIELVLYQAPRNVELGPDRRGYLLYFTIEEGWHLYDHHNRDVPFQPTDLLLKDPGMPPPGLRRLEVGFPRGKQYQFEFFPQPVYAYSGELAVSIWVEGKANLLPLVLSYQPCTDKICLSPTTLDIVIETSGDYPYAPPSLWALASEYEKTQVYPPAEQNREESEQSAGTISGPTSSGGGSEGGQDSTGTNSFQTDLSPEAGAGLFNFSRFSLPVVLVMVFFLGLALNLTPCVYPMIPLTVSIFGAQGDLPRSRSILLASTYVLGLVLVFAGLGTLAAITGQVFGSWLAKPAVLIALALLLVFLALSMFGLYEFTMPPSIMRLFGRWSRSPLGTFGMGASFGLVCSPCVGPVVAGLIAWVAATQNPTLGFVSFASLGLGIATPYFFLAIFSQRLNQLPRAGEWMVWVKQLFGYMLILLALLFLYPLPTMIRANFPWILTGLFLLAALHLGLFSRVKAGPVFAKVKMVVATFLVLVAVAIPPVSRTVAKTVEGGVEFSTYTKQSVEEAFAQGFAVMIDVRADWCISCLELELATFSKPRVAEALRREGIRAFKADITTGGSSDVRELMEEYEVLGIPAVLFLDPSGNELPNSRVVGFLNEEEFLDHLERWVIPPLRKYASRR